MPNKDDGELFLGPEQVVKLLQESSTLHFTVSLYFHTNPTIFRFVYTYIWLGLYEMQWNTEINWWEE